jgi:hypothetical protein
MSGNDDPGPKDLHLQTAAGLRLADKKLSFATQVDGGPGLVDVNAGAGRLAQEEGVEMFAGQGPAPVGRLRSGPRQRGAACCQACEKPDSTNRWAGQTIKLIFDSQLPEQGPACGRNILATHFTPGKDLPLEQSHRPAGPGQKNSSCRPARAASDY